MKKTETPQELWKRMQESVPTGVELRFLNRIEDVLEVMERHFGPIEPVKEKEEKDPDAS